MKQYIHVYPIDFRNTESNRKKTPPFSLSRILLGICTFSLEIAISFLFYRNKTIVENGCFAFKIAGKGQSDTWSVKKKTREKN